MEYNVEKLDVELRAAGLPIDGCDSDGGIQWDGEPTAEQLTSAAAVQAAHDPTPTRAQALAARGLNETDEAIRLVQIMGDSAPQWAKDAVQAYLARMADVISPGFSVQ